METPGAISTHDDSPRGFASLEQALAGSGLRNVSVAVIRIEQLLEIRTLYGQTSYYDAALRIQRALSKVVRARGYGARTGHAEYTLVLPNMYRRETVALLAAQLGQPERFEVEAGGEQVELLPEIATDTVALGETLRACHARLRAEIARKLLIERARLEGMAKIRNGLVRSGAKGLEQVKVRRF